MKPKTAGKSSLKTHLPEPEKSARKKAPPSILKSKGGKAASRIPSAVQEEVRELKNRLQEAEETLDAIRSGAVDALVVSAPEGEKVYTLKGAEYPYRIFFETMDEGGVVISAEGLVLACNKGFGRMAGVRPEKLCGSSFYDFIPPEEREKIRRFIASACSTGTARVRQQALRKETTLLASGDRKVPSLLAMSALCETEEAYVCVVITDLTDQKRAEEILRRSHDELELQVRQRTSQLEAQNTELNKAKQSLQQEKELLQGVMNSAKNSHLVYLDRDFNFVRVNETYAKTCGYTPEEMIGKNHFDLYPNEENEAIFCRVRDTGILAECHDKPFLFPDQPERGITYWDWTLAPIRDDSGSVAGLVLSLVETTNRQELEESLRIQSAQLEAARAKAENERRLLAAVMEALPIGMAITDVLGGNSQANSAFDRVWGGPRPETQSVEDYVAYKAWWVDTGNPVAPAEWASALAVRKGETIVGQLMRIQRFDGSEAFVLNSASPVRDMDGNIVGCAVAIQDITELRRAEEALRESEQRLRLVLEASSMGTFELDLLTGEGRWNDLEFELLGLRPGDAVASPETFFRYVHPEDVGLLRAQWAEALRIGTLDTEFRVVRADGEVRCLASKGKFIFRENTEAYAPQVRDQALLFLGVNFDITARKKAEAQIKALNEQLKLQVAELDAANKELDSFAHSVSHDLQAPLRTVSGFIKILAEDYAEQLDDQGRDYLSRVYKGAEKMSTLIVDLLYLSHLSRQELDRIEFNISNKASSIIEGLSAAEPGRRVEVNIEEGLSVTADPGLTDIVLSNLLGNSWKFTSKTDRARIEFGALHQDGKAVYYVRDNGVWFDPNYKEKLFAPFQRLHQDKDFEGSGIGLSIVERIIRRHGGKIWAEGEEGKGGTFFFTLG